MCDMFMWHLVPEQESVFFRVTDEIVSTYSYVVRLEKEEWSSLQQYFHSFICNT